MDYYSKIKMDVFSDEYYMFMKLNRQYEDDARRRQGLHIFKGNIRQLVRPVPNHFWDMDILVILNTMYPHSYFTQRERLIIYYQHTLSHHCKPIEVYERRLAKLSPSELELMEEENIIL